MDVIGDRCEGSRPAGCAERWMCREKELVIQAAAGGKQHNHARVHRRCVAHLRHRALKSLDHS